MFRSVTMTSGEKLATFSSASAPSEALSAAIPQAFTMPARPVRWLTSSSTIRTLNDFSTGYIVSFSPSAEHEGDGGDRQVSHNGISWRVASRARPRFAPMIDALIRRARRRYIGNESLAQGALAASAGM